MIIAVHTFNLSDIVIIAVTHVYKLLIDAGCIHTQKLVVCVYVFLKELGKITIHVGNHQNRAFYSKSLDMSHPCISHVNICSDYYCC